MVEYVPYFRKVLKRVHYFWEMLVSDSFKMLYISQRKAAISVSYISAVAASTGKSGTKELPTIYLLNELLN